MKYIKLFEEISIESIIDCIEDANTLQIDYLKDDKDFDKKTPIKPISVSENGIITIEYNGIYQDINIDSVNKINTKYINNFDDFN